MLTLKKIMIDVKHALEKHLANISQEELKKHYYVESIDEAIDKLTKYFKKFTSQFEAYAPDEEEVLDISIQFLLNGFSKNLQKRTFKLELLDGLGAIYINDELIASPAKKLYPLETAKGDLCWGYKNGSSTVRTAMVMLNASLYDFDENDTYYQRMSSKFADEILSQFTQNEHATYEEWKLLHWVSDYKMTHKSYGGENIVKLTCKEFGITYKELGEAIGYSGDSLRNIASKAEVSDPLTKAIELYKENLALKIQLQDYNTLKQALKNLIK